MNDNEKEKTAFACHKGLFEFNIMPIALSNAPAVFQELMAVVLQGIGTFTIAYLDDILVFILLLIKNVLSTEGSSQISLNH